MALSITQLSKYLTCRDSNPEELPWNGLGCLPIVSHLLKLCSSTNHQDVFHDIKKLPWNGLSCLSVVSYALKFCSATDHQDVFEIIKELDVIASCINQAKLYAPGEVNEKIEEFAKTFVKTFMPRVEVFFTLSEPEMEIAPFLHFLLQVLNSESDHIQQMALQEDVKLLYGELSFFLAVLGDTMFRYVELEEVKNLLTEFKAMSNEAGSFVYSSVFHTSPDNISRLCVKNVDFLNGKIEEFCKNFKELPEYMNAAYTNNTDVADALFIVNSLLQDLETFSPPPDLKDQTSNLKNELASAQSFLKYVSSSRVAENKKLKECVQIREASCEADYLINSFVVGNFPQWYLSLRIPNVIKKLELIGEGYKEFKTSHEINVPEFENDLSSQATPVVVYDHVFVGFETKMLEVQDRLTSEVSALQTISIWGMAGVGKTTFARKLFNHPVTIERFDIFAWCVISQTYQRRKMFIDILVGLNELHSSDEIRGMKDNELTERIHKTLTGRRFLVVMDDVWDAKPLDDAQLYFPNNEKGSRILFTTRNHGITINTITHQLPELSNDQCWELLEKKVFHGKFCPEELVASGKKIASKCRGIPLSVVVIASILAKGSWNKSYWEKVELSINEHLKDSMEILELSYKYLPNHLKLCFLYFVVYPEDTEIDVQNLIWSWISEGFVQTDSTRQEDEARRYLKDLVDMSLVQITKHGSTGITKSCGIHDLMREMCLKRATKENFMSFINNKDVSAFERHLRLSVSSATPTSMRPFSVHCRSFHGHLPDPSSCLPQMKHLRIMQLRSNECVHISYRLKSIDMLVHLKYLVVDRMPGVILDDLVNLEILVVNSNSSEVSVPPRILKMEKLRHLHVRREATFQPNCDSFQPNKLQSLSFISISSRKDFKILTSLLDLRKLKCLCPPKLTNFSIFEKLESLKIEVRGNCGVPNDVQVNFPKTIKKLSLYGTCFPWERMSKLAELPGLQSLKLLRKAFTGEDWETAEDGFQALIYLKLDGLKLVKWTVFSTSLPVLQHLVVNKCDALSDIPLEIGEIETMKLIEVRNCSAGVLESVDKIKEEQAEYDNTYLKFITTSDE